MKLLINEMKINVIGQTIDGLVDDAKIVFSSETENIQWTWKLVCQQKRITMTEIIFLHVSVVFVCLRCFIEFRRI